MMKNIVFIALISFAGLFAQDQETTDEKVNSLLPGDSRFLLRGYAHSGLEFFQEKSSFVGGSFNPIFLWQQSSELLFEAELELELEEGETHLALEYVNMAYILNRYMTLRLGMFLLPYGTFSERLHPRWINRLPSNPLGFGHDAVGPARDLGVEIRGALSPGNSKVNYSVYVTNGPRLNDGTDPDLESEEAGMLIYNNFEDNNNNKAVGGRLGLLPLSNSSLEVGVSSQYAVVGDRETEYENISAFLYALDLSFVSNVEFLSGVIDIKGQLNGVNVEESEYFNKEDSSFYTFENKSDSYYAQLSYRPSFVANDFLRNIELVGRYSALMFPEGSLWESEQTQWIVGINYWLDWRTVLKVAYQVTEGDHETNGSEEEAVFIHWAFGF